MKRTKKSHLNLKQQSVEEEKRETVQEQMPSNNKSNNMAKEIDQINQSMVNLKGMMSIIFSLNKEMKIVLQTQQSIGNTKESILKRLFKDIDSLNHQVNINCIESKTKTTQILDFGRRGAKVDAIDQTDFFSKIMDLKKDIDWIEETKKQELFDDMRKSLNSLKSKSVFQETLFEKCIEFQQIIEQMSTCTGNHFENIQSCFESMQGVQNLWHSNNQFFTQSYKNMNSNIESLKINQFESLSSQLISQLEKSNQSFINQPNSIKISKFSKSSKASTVLSNNLNSVKTYCSNKFTNKSLFNKERSKKYSQLSRMEGPKGQNPKQFFSMKLDNDQVDIIFEENLKLKIGITKALHQVEFLKKISKDFQKRNDDIESKYKKYKNKNANLKNENKKLKDEIQTKDEIIEDLKTECYQLEMQLESLGQPNEYTSICQNFPTTGGDSNCPFSPKIESEKRRNENIEESHVIEVHNPEESIFENQDSSFLENENQSNEDFNMKQVKSLNKNSFDTLQRESKIRPKSIIKRNPDTQEFNNFENITSNSFYSLNNPQENVFFNSKIEVNKVKSNEKHKKILSLSGLSKENQSILKSIAKSEIKKMKNQIKLKFSKNSALNEKQNRIKENMILSKNNNAITFQMLKNSLTSKEKQEILKKMENKRCSIDVTFFNLEKLKRQLTNSDFNLSCSRFSDNNLGDSRENLINKYKTLKDLLLLPVKSLQLSENFALKKISKENGDQIEEQDQNQKTMKLEKKIFELKKKVEDLEEELMDLYSENEFYKQNWPMEDEMESKLTSTSLNHNNNEELLILEQEISILNESLFAKKESEKMLKKMLESVEGKYKICNADLTNALEEINILKLEKNELLLELNEHEANIQELEELIFELEGQKNKEASISRNLDVNESMNFFHVNLKQNEEIDKLKKKNQEIEDQNMELFSKLNELEEERDTIKCEFEEIKKSNTNNLNKIEAFKSSQIILEDQNEKSKLEYSLMQNHYEKQNKEYTLLKLEISKQKNFKNSKNKDFLMQPFQKHKNRLNKLMKYKFEIIWKRVKKLDRLTTQIALVPSKIQKIKEILNFQKKEIGKLNIEKEELKQSLKKMEMLREEEIAKRNKLFLIDSSEEVLSDLSNSISKVNISKVSNKSRNNFEKSQIDEKEKENTFLKQKNKNFENIIKNCNAKINQLTFENNELTIEKELVQKKAQKEKNQSQLNEYFNSKIGSNHIELKKQNLELKQKLKKILKEGNKNKNSQFCSSVSFFKNSWMQEKIKRQKTGNFPEFNSSKNKFKENGKVVESIVVAADDVKNKKKNLKLSSNLKLASNGSLILHNFTFKKNQNNPFKYTSSSKILTQKDLNTYHFLNGNFYFLSNLKI